MATVVESSRSSTSVPRNNTNSGSFSGPKNDLEAQQTTACSEETSQSSSLRDISGDSGLQDNSNVPRLSLPRLFWFFFYNFGLFAWGGPVAQISLIKEHLVLKEKWITLPRFQRVFAVYQILPGPEAAELCMFFGCLSAGRLGGIVAGLAFILPGFLLMLLASYLYSLAGLENIYFNASFRAIQPIVSAMILRATHKIADHSVVDHSTHKINPYLVIAGLCTALNTALRINIFISLGLYGVIYSFISRGKRIIAICLFILQYVVYTIYVVFRGVPSPVSLALGIAKTPFLPNLFALGLVAGSLSFGGAYTAIPFMQVEAVLKGGWLPARIFLDGIAIGNILPAPLVIFATFVGFQGGLADGNLGTALAGAVVITLGMFFPCFLFTIAGHDLLEKLVRNEFLSAFFDGLCGAVIGVIAIIALQTLRSSLEVSDSMTTAALTRNVINAESAASASVLYVVALAVLYKFTNKYTPLLLVAVGAIAGQFLFV
ncbi:chromate transport protein [Aspergillus udagawae]|nr:chromate transport protein [Aspergillus udagawae]GFG19105.1 chromate transport protein [Aspergillus udagawae]